MCDVGSGSSDCEHLWVSQPIARRQHSCCECGSLIQPGEQYELVRGVWDGQFDTYKTCSFCASARARAHGDFDLNSDEDFPFGQLWECVGWDYLGL